MATTVTFKLNKDATQFQAGESIGFGIRGGVKYYDRQTKQDAYTNFEAVIFAKQHLLRLGIILYGFRLTFSQIADVGVSGIVIDVLTLSSTFMIACFLGQKVFGLDRHTSWLIGAGSSICGAAAVLATEPVVKAQASKVTVAVATVVAAPVAFRTNLSVAPVPVLTSMSAAATENRLTPSKLAPPRALVISLPRALKSAR